MTRTYKRARLLMTTPGGGAIVLTFACAIEPSAWIAA
jgi:hypothetical protein